MITTVELVPLNIVTWGHTERLVHGGRFICAVHLCSTARTAHGRMVQDAQGIIQLSTQRSVHLYLFSDMTISALIITAIKI